MFVKTLVLTFMSSLAFAVNGAWEEFPSTSPLIEIGSPSILGFRSARDQANRIASYRLTTGEPVIRFFKLRTTSKDYLGLIQDILSRGPYQTHSEAYDFRCVRTTKSQASWERIYFHSYLHFPKSASSTKQSVVGIDSAHRYFIDVLTPALQYSFNQAQTDFFIFSYLNYKFHPCAGVFIIDRQSNDAVQVLNCAS